MKLYKSLLALEKKSPEIFYLLKNVKIEESEKCPTAYVTVEKNSFKLVINRQWVESFDEFNLSAIIEHEVLHIVLNHLSDKAYTNKSIANIAMDSIINDIGNCFQDKSKLNEELQKGVFLDALNEKYGTDFCSSKNSVREIYDFLLTQENASEDFPCFDQGLTQETSGENEENSEELSKALESILGEKEIESIVKEYSKNSKEFKEYFSKIEKREKNKKVGQAIQNFFSSNKNNHKKSIKRVNKRFNFLPFGRTKDSTQNVLIALDVSGSMINPEEIEKMKMTISTALNFGFSVDLIFGDTKKIGEFKDIKKSFDFSQVYGGGGTELSFIFNEKLSNYDCLVVLTDGYFDHKTIPLKEKSKILFLNTTSNEIKNFKNLYI